MKLTRMFKIAMETAKYESKTQHVGNMAISYNESFEKYQADYNGIRIRFDTVRYDDDSHVLWFNLDTHRKTYPIVGIPIGEVAE